MMNKKSVSTEGQRKLTSWLQKFMDYKNDINFRIKYLKNISTYTGIKDCMNFYRTHTDMIFSLFYEQFINLQLNTKRSSVKNYGEDLKQLLDILQRIFVYAPGKVTHSWYQNSIYRVIKQLLGLENSFCIRSKGIELYVLWLTCLKNVTTDKILNLMYLAIPGTLVYRDYMIESGYNVYHYEQVDADISISKTKPVKAYSLASILQSNNEITLKTEDIHSRSRFTFLCYTKLPSPLNLATLTAPIKQAIPVNAPLQTSIQTPNTDDTIKCLNIFLRYLSQSIHLIEFENKSDDFKRKTWICLFHNFINFIIFPIFRTSSDTNNYLFEKDNNIVDSCSFSGHDYQIFVPSNISQDAKLDVDEKTRRYCAVVICKWLVWNLFVNIKNSYPDVESPFKITTTNSTNSDVDSVNEIDPKTDEMFQNIIHFVENSFDVFSKQALFHDIPSLISSSIFSSDLGLKCFYECIRQAFKWFTTENILLYMSLFVFNVWLTLNPALLLSYSGQCSFGNVNLVERQQMIIVSICCSLFDYNYDEATENMHLRFCKVVLRIIRCYIATNELKMSKKLWHHLIDVMHHIAAVSFPQYILPNTSTRECLHKYLLNTYFITWIRANCNVSMPKEQWFELKYFFKDFDYNTDIVETWKSACKKLNWIFCLFLYDIDLEDLPLSRLRERTVAKQQASKKNKKCNKRQKHMSQVFMTQFSTIKEIINSKNSNDDSLVEIKLEESNLTAAPKTDSFHHEFISTAISLNEIMGNTNNSIEQRDNDFHDLDDIDKKKITKQASTLDSSVASRKVSKFFKKKKYLSCMDVENKFKNLEKSKEKSEILSFDDSKSELEKFVASNDKQSYRGYSDSIPEEKGISQTNDHDSTSKYTNSMEQSNINNSASSDKAVDRFDTHYETPKVHLENKTDESSEIVEDSSKKSFEMINIDTTEDDTRKSVGMKSSIILSTSRTNDVLSVDENSERKSEIIEHQVHRSWNTQLVIQLWSNFMLLVGDLEDIKSENIRIMIIKTYRYTYRSLLKVYQNQGVTEDNKTSPSMPSSNPPLFYFAPIIFNYLNSYDSNYKESYICAMKFMLETTSFEHFYIPLSNEYLIQFYHCYFYILDLKIDEITTELLNHSHNLLFYNIPGITMFLPRFLFALKSLILANYSSSQKWEEPRMIKLLCAASVYVFEHEYLEVPVNIYSEEGENIIVPLFSFKDDYFSIVIEVCKKEPNPYYRVLALNTLTQFCLYIIKKKEQNSNFDLHKCLALLLIHLTVDNCYVCFAALANLKVINLHMESLRRFDKSIPYIFSKSIVEALRMNYNQLISTSFSKELYNYVSVLINAVLEFVFELKEEDFESNEIRSIFFNKLHYTLSLFIENKKESCEEHTLYEHISFGKVLNIEELRVYSAFSDSHSNSENDMSENKNTYQNFNYFSEGSVDEESELKTKQELLYFSAKQVLDILQSSFGIFPLPFGVATSSCILPDNLELDESKGVVSLGIKNKFVLTIIEDNYLLNNSNVELENDRNKDQAQDSDPSKKIKNQNSEFAVKNNYATFIVRNAFGKFAWKMKILTEDQTDVFEPCSGKAVISPKYYKNDYCSIEDAFENLKNKYVNDTSGTKDYIREYLTLDKLPFPNLTKEFIKKMGVFEKELDSETTLEDMHTLLEDIKYNAPHHSYTKTNKPNNFETINKSLMKITTQIFSSFGWFEPSVFKNIKYLQNSNKFWKEIKELDKRPIRHCHKVAVFYVGKYQEDRSSILSNTCGSKKFEEFIQQLGWEVDLSKHCGFMGGLERNKTTGESTPYFANINTEVIFHVSTRIPVSEENGFITKMRHLGNDEIHIVWSEHVRPFRRGIINTEFADLIIVIYPMKNSLFKIQILNKTKIPIVGPLHDGSIVSFKHLAPMILMTCTSVSTIIKTSSSLYKHIYEDRVKYIESFIKKYSENLSFKDFLFKLFCPINFSKFITA